MDYSEEEIRQLKAQWHDIGWRRGLLVAFSICGIALALGLFITINF